MIEGYEITSSKGAVAAGPQEAARIGAQILERGGNAMDAAAATSLACAMMEPYTNGVGGYMMAAVVLEGETGRLWSLDSNAISPAGAREDMYEILPRADVDSVNENEYACSVRDNANVYGPLAVAVPGQMAGMGMLWERWGQLKWEEIVAPSQGLLEEGFAYGERLVGGIEQMEAVLRQFAPSVAHLMPQGKKPKAEDIWHRPDMEKTLARLAAAGWRDFYEGELGWQIADALQEMGGIVTRQDMAAFEPRFSEPYAVTYRGAEIYAPILPNGCLSSLQILQMLECFAPLQDDQVLYWHRLAEVLKLAWRDRLLYVGDPDFVDVPIERLLSKDYAAGRVETLKQFPEQIDRSGWGLSSASLPETLHLSTADAQGNVVAATITQGGAFGSCVTVPGTGIMLGHGMCRLDPRPGQANSVAPGKRPLNNTAPVIVRTAERDIALGMPGGRRIISVVPRMVERMVDFAASAFEAASAPRMHVGSEEPVEIQDTLDNDIVQALEKMGHRIKRVATVGSAAHIAEFFKADRKVRAGGNTWAAGVE